MSLTIHNCPFCNHEDIKIDHVDGEEFYITCKECFADGPLCSDVMSAIAAWNNAPRQTPYEPLEIMA